jgi:hypothetical protein
MVFGGLQQERRLWFEEHLKKSMTWVGGFRNGGSLLVTLLVTDGFRLLSFAAARPGKLRALGLANC